MSNASIKHLHINSRIYMKDLSEYTDKELRQELYRRSKKNKISERDKKKCFNCKHRIPYTKAKKIAKLLPFKSGLFPFRSICLKCKNMDGYHLIVSNHTFSCNLFEKK